MRRSCSIHGNDDTLVRCSRRYGRWPWKYHLIRSIVAVSVHWIILIITKIEPTEHNRWSIQMETRRAYLAFTLGKIDLSIFQTIEQLCKIRILSFPRVILTATRTTRSWFRGNLVHSFDGQEHSETNWRATSATWHTLETVATRTVAWSHLVASEQRWDEKTIFKLIAIEMNLTFAPPLAMYSNLHRISRLTWISNHN